MAKNRMKQEWRVWCRLCAKADKRNNIDVFLDGQNMITVSSIEHLFGICIRQSDDLPHMLCTECLSLLTALSKFTERVSKVQTMFRKLQERNMRAFSDLRDVRKKFNLFDEEREHVIFLQPITEVQCNEIKSEKTDATQRKRHTKKIVELEECLLEEENEDLKEFITDDEKDPFSSNESDDSVQDNFSDDFNDDNDSAKKKDSPVYKKDHINMRQTRQSTKQKMSSTPPNDNSGAPKMPTKHSRIPSTSVDGTKCLFRYQCTDCPEKFKLLRDYRLHIKSTHPKYREKPKFPCEQCSRVFNKPSKLAIHAKIHIPMELKKIVPCPHCDKKFTTNSVLQTHISCIHMDLRPFICEECGLALRTKSTLKSHLLTHSDLKPFTCDVCNKGFKERINLKKHLEIHDPNKHICAKCGLGLNSRRTLSRHMLVHSDEMKHKCHCCGRKFKRAKALKIHLLLHTGIKPYSCDFCDRSFASSANCRLHSKKVHPEELAALEASGGGKVYTCNMPKMEVLLTLSKTADKSVVSKPTDDFGLAHKSKEITTQPTNISTSNTNTSVDANSNKSTAYHSTSTAPSIPTAHNIYMDILATTNNHTALAT